MTVCAACKLPLNNNEKIVCCTPSCSKPYHFLCVNLTTTTFKKQTKWTCPACAAKFPKSDNSNTPIKPQTEQHASQSLHLTTDSRSNVTTRRNKSPVTEEPPTNVSTTATLESLIKQLPSMIKNALSTELQPIKLQISNLESSLQFISAQYDDIMKRFEQKSDEIKSLTEENAALRRDLAACDARVSHVECDMARQQQWARLQNVEIVGVPELKSENTTDIILKVAERLGLTLPKEEIEFAHRVQPRRASPGTRSARAIVVRFKRRSTKDAVVAAARRTRTFLASDLGLSTDPNVSWIRHRDLHILTVGSYTYTSDQRFQATHSPLSDDWTLQIKWAQQRDAGVYECQVSTQPVRSFFVTLHVVVPSARILGGPDLHVDIGSTINLTCLIQFSPEAPAYIFWYHEDEVISYDSARGGVSVVTEKGPATTSHLLVQDATPRDSGRYSCAPSNAGPASIRVHVLNGERPAAMQTGTAGLSDSAGCMLALLLASTLYAQLQRTLLTR